MTLGRKKVPLEKQTHVCIQGCNQFCNYMTNLNQPDGDLGFHRLGKARFPRSPQIRLGGWSP